jgi:cobaltochelatase CobN
MSHSYTEKNWGYSNPDLFENELQGINTAYHSRSTNLYGVLDNDDYYDYYGGLSMAIEKVNNGNAPNLNVLYYANPARPQVMSLQTFMTQEMRTRYYNPEWIQGMMNQGYSGARYVSNKFVSYLWGWQVTSPDTVKNWMWEEVTNTYVKDQYDMGVNKWLSSGNNVYAMISITGTLLTAADKGYWKTDDATLRLVANTWANAIAQNGVACCDCSCGNLAMMTWATQYINPDILARFNAQMFKATMNPSFAANQVNSQPTASNPSQSTASGRQGSTASLSNPGPSENQQSNAGQSPGDQGKATYEVTKSGSSGSSQTGMPIVAIIGVVLIIGLVGFGYFRTGILNWFRK